MTTIRRHNQVTTAFAILGLCSLPLVPQVAAMTAAGGTALSTDKASDFAPWRNF